METASDFGSWQRIEDFNNPGFIWSCIVGEGLEEIEYERENLSHLREYLNHLKSTTLSVLYKVIG